MSLYAGRVTTMDYMDHVIDMIERKPPPEEPQRFEDMDALKQRREMSYYMAEHKGAMQEAINDELNWTDAERLWGAADVTGLWYLIDRALAKGLAERINKANGVPEDDQ